MHAPSSDSLNWGPLVALPISPAADPPPARRGNTR
eukprot:CAMPEP_0198603768 /NCGR_PEP_ID=MMETSP1462-20131121/152379_1 /TAXON_ID=1333877 /ORGANISM="Brandtodinium nutriculum, Strain RCC3387" /LENGTH=34 /DNA_ID= /DNA_START= /DNA_END= /DNA_ORIENTATION=